MDLHQTNIHAGSIRQHLGERKARFWTIHLLQLDAWRFGKRGTECHVQRRRPMSWWQLGAEQAKETLISFSVAHSGKLL